jgi:hypothetical protein
MLRTPVECDAANATVFATPPTVTPLKLPAQAAETSRPNDSTVVLRVPPVPPPVTVTYVFESASPVVAPEAQIRMQGVDVDRPETYSRRENLLRAGLGSRTAGGCCSARTRRSCCLMRLRAHTAPVLPHAVWGCARAVGPPRLARARRNTPLRTRHESAAHQVPLVSQVIAGSQGKPVVYSRSLLCGRGRARSAARAAPLKNTAAAASTNSGGSRAGRMVKRDILFVITCS